MADNIRTLPANIRRQVKKRFLREAIANVVSMNAIRSFSAFGRAMNLRERRRRFPSDVPVFLAALMAFSIRDADACVPLSYTVSQEPSGDISTANTVISGGKCPGSFLGGSSFGGGVIRSRFKVRRSTFRASAFR